MAPKDQLRRKEEVRTVQWYSNTVTQCSSTVAQGGPLPDPLCPPLLQARAVKKRLTIRHDDSEENVQNRVNHYDDIVPHMKKMYAHVSSYVPADRVPDEVCGP
eukprot:1195177-Prorocentrum_minimum.AAC.4